MRNRFRFFALFAVVALLGAACGDDGDAAPDEEEAPGVTDAAESSTTAPTTTATIPEGGEALVELQITAVTFGPEGSVTIQNRGADDADVSGISICNRPNYADLGDLVAGGVIAAGASVEIPAASLGGLAEAGGEAALYNGSDFESSDAIFSYVQWGGGGGRGAVAADAGIWPAADAAVTPDPEFGGIELFGDPVDPASWG